MTLSHSPRPRLGARGVLGVLATTIMVLSSTMVAGSATAASSRAEIGDAGTATAIPGSYIVVLTDSAVGGKAGTRQAELSATASSLAGRYGGTLGRVYGDALNGFQVHLTEFAARRLAQDPAVAYVEQDRTVQPTTVQTNAPWNLDRIDQPALPMNSTYSFTSAGTGVKAYIIDSGVQIGHQDFGGQAIYGYDAVDGLPPANDCTGHGTHAAGTVGGTWWGVAKDVVLVAVKVFDCGVPGQLSTVIAGINWVTADHLPGQPAVANLGVQTSSSSALNTAVTNAIADGVSYTVAAGNSNANACNYSPGSTPTAITVGATGPNDARASWSNFGPCLDFFAPGVTVTSTWYTSISATTPLSGTSQAAPHLAGAVARVLSNNPTWTPAQVQSYLVSTATIGVVTNPGTGSPNRLLYLSPTG
ncbi:S8 family peptidase [Micromonospora sp. NPDC003197]